jgi:hypothetical protein
MIQSAMWGSDSCGCVFDEYYDDDFPNERTIKKAVFICDLHNPEKNIGIKTVQDAHKIAHEENSAKEKLRQAIIDSNALPLAAISTKTSYDEETKTAIRTSSIHEGIMFKYYYTGEYGKDSRKIVYSLEGLDKNDNVLILDNNQKASINTVVSSKMGIGKCVHKDLITEKTDDEYKKALASRNRGTNEFIREHARLEEERETKSKAKETLVKFFGNRL